MKVLKPHWVSHDDLPIYSIDIHPDGSRFATGGQGEDSGRVVIWNMAPVADEATEMNEKVPKMLCQLDNHLACVNCVRWSYSGRYLASGGDDKMIMVWVTTKCPSGSNVVFGSKGAVNVESWRCVSTLKRHDGDVLDIAWSPHDNWLATCSVDNTVIIWDAQKFPEVVAILKGHTGLVKGVTWDPVGKYLSSQSDDKTLRIWRTADWQEEAVIQKPFKECAGTTLVLRLGWSPDGQYLVSAHAMNNAVPTAQIIDREGWKHDIDFVGHRKAVTCVRFNSNILLRDFTRSGKPQHASCCAIGSRDRSISVWVTALKRPLFAMNNLFSRPVLDITWSSSGLQLMACSLDGTVAYLEFTEQELGRPLTVDEKNSLYEKTYGKSFASGQPASAVLLENPSLINVNKRPLTTETKVSPTKTATPSTVSPAKPLTNKQIETRTTDGRRRITPVFIPAEVDTGEGPTPFSSELIKFSSSNESKSRIVIERREDVVNPNVFSPVKASTNQPQSRQSTIKGVSVAESVQKPMAPFKRNLDKTLSVISKKASRFPDNMAVSVVSGGLRREIDVSGRSLPCPQLPPINRYSIPGSPKCLVIENESCLSPFGRLTQVKLILAGKVQWETVLGFTVCVFAANTSLVVAACVDSSLHTFDTVTGAQVLPTFVLSSPAAHLALAATKLLCITTDAQLNVWCLNQHRALITNRSLQPVLTLSSRISKCSVTQAGVPTVILDSGKAFMYSLEFETWMRLVDHTDPVVRNTQRSFQCAWQSIPDSGAVPLRTVLSQCHSSTDRGLTHCMDNTSICTQSYLEDQLVICKALNSAMEYQFWFITHVRFLLQEGLESRLRTICETLLRKTSETDINCLWNPALLGIDRLSLLREVLAEMYSHPHTQRLYIEYNEQLNSSVT